MFPPCLTKQVRGEKKEEYVAGAAGFGNQHLRDSAFGLLDLRVSPIRHFPHALSDVAASTAPFTVRSLSFHTAYSGEASGLRDHRTRVESNRMSCLVCGTPDLSEGFHSPRF